MGDVPKAAIDIWYQCQRKKRYENKKTANKRAREWGQYVYECPQCKFYHLTTKPQGDANA